MLNQLAVVTSGRRSLHRGELALRRMRKFCFLADRVPSKDAETVWIHRLLRAAASAATVSMLAASNAYSLLCRHSNNVDDVLDLQSTINAAVDSIVAIADSWEAPFVDTLCPNGADRNASGSSAHLS